MGVEKVLVVDDEKLIRDFVREALERKKIEVVTASNGKEALAAIKEETFDMIFTDMKMPGATGLEVIRKAREQSPKTVVIVITAFGSIENAVEAMKAGAFNYLIKPFTADIINAVIEKATDQISLVGENLYLRESDNQHTKIIAASQAMMQILDEVEKIAQSNAAVFISGESGTGKEVIAHAIHYHSHRSEKPFIKVNCAAMPESLIESEFFGHEKGAFTGANNKKEGRFELADKGSLLLDEITEIPLSLQAKLLRVTQEQEFERVGGTKSIQVDVRLISTSNRDIKEAITNKILREDLYYRLNVVPIYLPSLRERPDDIIPLANYFLEKMCIENHKSIKKLTNDAKKKLLTYTWPGNVRELANIIERAVVLDRGEKISAENIYLENMPHDISVQLSLQELEKRHIVETLQAQNNDRQKAARILGITEKTLSSKLVEYNVNF